MILLAAVLAIGHQSGSVKSHRIDSFLRDLKVSRKLAGDSMEKYMWRIYHLTDDAIDGQNWSAVRRGLTAQGASFTQQTGYESAEVTVPGTDFVTKSGLTHRLVIRINMKQVIAPNGRPDMHIDWVWPRLIAEPGVKFEDFVKSNPYSGDSVLGRVLQRDGTKSLAKMNPIVAEIRLEYSPEYPTIDDETSPGQHWPYDFVGAITLAKPDKTDATLDYRSESGYDPHHDIDGKPVTDGFNYSETAGSLRRPDFAGEDEVFSSSGPGTDEYLYIEKTTPPSPEPTSAYCREDLQSLPATTKSLELRGTEFGEGDYQWLSRFKSLESLSLRSSDSSLGPNSGDLIVLSKLKSLKKLEIRLDKTPIDLSTARAIGSLPHLETATFYFGHLDPRCLAAVVRAPKLTSLDVYSADQYSERELAPVWKKRNWKDLDLFTSKKINDKELRRLSKLKNLTMLSLTGVDNSREAKVIQILRSRPLRSVDFYDSKITPQLLAAAASCDSLENLTFSDCHGLSDSSILALKRLERLKSVSFVRSTKVSREGAKKLAAALKGRYELS